MTFEAAMNAAEELTGLYQVELGPCLFSGPLQDEGWVFSFDIDGGPVDWSWSAVVFDDPVKSVLFAMRHRPSPILRPKIRRRWLLFGERVERLPIGR